MIGWFSCADAMTVSPRVVAKVESESASESSGSDRGVGGENVVGSLVSLLLMENLFLMMSN